MMHLRQIINNKYEQLYNRDNYCVPAAVPASIRARLPPQAEAIEEDPERKGGESGVNRESK